MRVRFIISLLALSAVAFFAARDVRSVSGSPLTDVVSISAGGLHTCALTSAGQVFCWGDATFGKLGAGDPSTSIQPRPTAVTGLDKPVASIDAGSHHTCAVTVAGGAFCWGWNFSGQLGREEPLRCSGRIFQVLPECSSLPVQVKGLEQGVVAVAAGDSHSCALTDQGGVKCWGLNDHGQLGNGTTANSSLPVDVAGLAGDVVAIDAGYKHTCAVTSMGEAWCWGSNSAMQIGDGFPEDQQELCIESVFGFAEPCRTEPARVCQQIDDEKNRCGEWLTDVRGVSTSSNFTCAVASGGRAKCWGASQGIGQGESIISPLPGAVCGEPSCETTLTEVSSISAGRNSLACALTNGGTVKCWGVSYRGAVGDGTEETRFSAVAVLNAYDGSPLGGVNAVSTGGAHTCALTVSGQVLCWGDNGAGQLGIGSNDQEAHPHPLEVLGPMQKGSGDADCSGATDSNDALALLRLDAGVISFLPCPGAGDKNMDGRLNSVDAALVLQVVAGLRT